MVYRAVGVVDFYDLLKMNDSDYSKWDNTYFYRNYFYASSLDFLEITTEDKTLWC